MWHLAANTVALGTTADTDVPALTDDILSIQNTHFVLQSPMRLLWVWTGSATHTRTKIVSPSLRQVANPYVRPIGVTALPPANPNLWILVDNPPVLQPFEEIQIKATSAIAMGTERYNSVMAIGDGIDTAPLGNVYPLRWTSVTAAVANVWTSLTITFEDVIPSGVYAAVFSEAFATSNIAHRWIFSNQLWRPGFLGAASVGLRQPYAIDGGKMGRMGMFRSNDLPRVQVLNNGTDNAHEGYLHVVRVGQLAA